MTVRRIALIGDDNLVENIAVWDDEKPDGDPDNNPLTVGTTWDLEGHQEMDVTSMNVRQGQALHYRPNGATWNYNFVIDGNSLAQACEGQTTIREAIEESDAITGAYDILCQAKSGYTTPVLASRAANYIDPLIEEEVPNILIFWEGSNDLALNANRTAQECYDNIKSYCEARKAAGWDIIVGTLTPRSNAANQNFESIRLVVNQMLRDAVTNEELWIDALADVASDDTIGGTGDSSDHDYYYDGLHLSAAGIAMAKAYFRDAINELVA